MSGATRRNILQALGAGVGIAAASTLAAAGETLRATGDLGLVVERQSGSLLLVSTTTREILARIEGCGDLSHASAVFSRDMRYGYVFGRDGGLTKIDLLTASIAGRIVQAGNAIGGAISQDGSLIAVSNYEPGGVNVFDAETLEPLASIPAETKQGFSKVVGLSDAPGQRFIFTLYEAGEIWIADLSTPARPAVQRFADVGDQPYDALMSPDGRFYIAGLFGEDGLALLDLWQEPLAPRRILSGYGRGEQPLPVFKMPHLEGWAVAGGEVVIPAIGREEVLYVTRDEWTIGGRTSVYGQPVFAVARPDGRQVWVNFAVPKNDTVQVIDVVSREVIRTLKPGKAIMHMEFTPRGEEVWISARDSNRIVVYDTASFEQRAALEAKSPSGIFFTSRAHRIGL